MNSEDRVIICTKFAEIRKLMWYQLAILAAIAGAIGVQIPAID